MIIDNHIEQNKAQYDLERQNTIDAVGNMCILTILESSKKQNTK